MKASEEKDESKVSIWILIGLVVLVLLIFFASWLIIKIHYSGVTDYNGSRGTFGDQFGAVNALFSALAFAGLIYTIILQTKELGFQRKELEENRKEMTRQTDEFQTQNQSMLRQSFENSFFNMLSILQQIVNDMVITTSDIHWLREDTVNGPMGKEQLSNIEIKGRECFSYLFHHYSNESVHPIKGLAYILIKDGFKGYDESNYRTYFDHYFRFIYRILKYVDTSELLFSTNKREEERRRYEYATILRGTLSRYELVLLYYNGLSAIGKQKLKPLLEKYCMLNNLNKELLTISKNTVTNLKANNTENAYKYLKSHGFTGTDYELLITDNKEQENKYYYTAFAHTELEKTECLSLIKRVNQEIN